MSAPVCGVVALLVLTLPTPAGGGSDETVEIIEAPALSAAAPAGLDACAMVASSVPWPCENPERVRVGATDGRSRRGVR